MAASELAQVQDQVQTFWGSMFMDELLETAPLPALINKEYEGEIRKGGDRVRVSQINRPSGEIKSTADSTFSSEQISTSYVDIIADKRITVAYEFSDLIDLQSQIGDQGSKIRQALIEAANIKLNTHLYSLVAPSTSAPDHSIASVTDFNATQLLAIRKLAAQAKWNKQGGWWLLADPSYTNDLLGAQTLTSSDYAEGRPVVGGAFVNQRFGFNILEDNSAGMSQLSPSAAAEDYCLAFHPDFMHLVMPRQATFKVSDLHSNKQHGYLISVDMVFGAKLGIDGDLKHIVVYNA